MTGARPPRRRGQGLIEWGVFTVKFGVIIWVLLSMGGIWSLKVLSAGYQVLGALLALLGVATIGDLVERTAAAIETWATTAPQRAREHVGRWWERQRTRAGRWWAQRRGRPYPAFLSGTMSATSSATATITAEKIERPRPDPATTSDHDWIVRLEADVVGLLARADKADKTRGDQDAEFRKRLRTQADDLRSEIFRASRTGWPLVVAGLGFSAVGAAIGGWA